MDCHTFGVRCTAALLAIVIAPCLHPVLSAQARKLPRIRAMDSRADALIAEGRLRSPAFRSLLERLDQSTVVVYVGFRMLPTELAGQLTLLASSGKWRYVRIDIECRQPANGQIAALGHELQHAVEVAEAPDVDPLSMQALFRRIGFSTDETRRRFETAAARDIGVKVRRELAAPEARLASR